MEPLSEQQKMLAGQLYRASDPALVLARRQARVLTGRYNGTAPDETAERERLLRDLLGGMGAGVEIEPPFRCDYGRNIVLGDMVYFNFNCVILDCAPVRLGDRVACGPGVHIYAATHPLAADVRAQGLELAKPVTIGDDVWIGGGTIVCPGVTIGAKATIGAGSVVTRDIPANVLAVGNPCRVIRELG